MMLNRKGILLLTWSFQDCVQLLNLPVSIS